ncbi:putative phosphatidylglycerol/ phosphatidylinositol transfer protein DDB_G0282179 [Fagus crenata]
MDAAKLTLLLLFSALYLVLLPTQATDVKYCDKKGNYAVKVNGVEISPNPVVSGKPATFNISASTGQAISSGKVLIEVSYFGVHVHTEKHDLSEEISCPIAVGNFVLTHSQTLPGFTPPGSYTLKMTLEDGNNQLLTCISFNFKISFGSSVSAS